MVLEVGIKIKMQRQIAELGSQSLISKNKDLLDTTRAAQEGRCS